jgi:hypothetical protein
MRSTCRSPCIRSSRGLQIPLMPITRSEGMPITRSEGMPITRSEAMPISGSGHVDRSTATLVFSDRYPLRCCFGRLLGAERRPSAN